MLYVRNCFNVVLRDVPLMRELCDQQIDVKTRVNRISLLPFLSGHADRMILTAAPRKKKDTDSSIANEQQITRLEQWLSQAPG
jgi:hypothetical protein